MEAQIRIGIVQTYEPGEREAYPLGLRLSDLGADWVGLEARYLKAAIDDRGAPTIVFDGDPEISVRHLDDLALDAIVWRVSEADFYNYGNVFELMASRYLMLNDQRCTWVCSDKWRTSASLAAAGITVVPTVLLTPGRPVPAFAGHKTVVKPAVGASGNGVRLAAAGAVLDIAEPYVAQPLVAGPSSEHVRVIVVGSEPVVSIHRIPGEKQLGNEIEVNNVAAGGRPVAAPMGPVRDIAVRVAQSVGGDVIGIDFVPWKGGYAVLEVNSSPGFNGIAEFVGVDCFRHAAEQVLGRLTASGAAVRHKPVGAGSGS